MKKVICIFVILFLLICSFSLFSCQNKIQEEPNPDNNIENKDDLIFTLLENDTYAVRGEKNLKDVNVIIPSSYKGKEVTTIGSFYHSNLESIVLPDTIKSIDSSAFSNCTSLKSINLPNSIEYIGNNAFVLCRSLTNIVIPDSVTILNKGTFNGCTSLSSISIGNNISLIDDMCFYNCASIKEITITSSIKYIGKQAFYNCLSLETVYVEDLIKWDEIIFMDECSNPMFYAGSLIELN